MVGRAGHGRRRGLLRHARRLPEGGRCEDGKELYKFKTPSGIIGNVTTYEHKGKQYIAVLSGVGGWAGIGLAAGLLDPENAAAWHGAVDQGRKQGERSAGRHRRSGRGRRLCRHLPNYTTLGGKLTVFALPK